MTFFNILRCVYYVVFIGFVILVYDFFKQFRTYEDPSEKKLEEMDKKISYIAQRCGYKDEDNTNEQQS